MGRGECLMFLRFSTVTWICLHLVKITMGQECKSMKQRYLDKQISLALEYEMKQGKGYKNFAKRTHRL